MKLPFAYTGVCRGGASVALLHVKPCPRSGRRAMQWQQSCHELPLKQYIDLMETLRKAVAVLLVANANGPTAGDGCPIKIQCCFRSCIAPTITNPIEDSEKGRTCHLCITVWISTWGLIATDCLAHLYPQKAQGNIYVSLNHHVPVLLLAALTFRPQASWEFNCPRATKTKSARWLRSCHGENFWGK